MSVLDNSFELIFEVDDEKDTARVAEALAVTAEPGAVLVLTGGLGAGKTTLVKYLAEKLAIDPTEVRSPTFTLVHEYHSGTLPLVHVDVYRLPDPTEFEAMGGFEYLDNNEGIVVIEWGEQVLDALDPDWLQLKLERHSESERRSFLARCSGPGGTAWLQRFKNRLNEEEEG